MIHDLLDLGRLKAGVTHLERQSISLKDLMDRAVRGMELRMQARGLVAQLAVVEDLQFTGDPERLLQALLNVLDNAIKHSQLNSEVFFTGYREKRSVVIQIRD